MRRLKQSGLTSFFLPEGTASPYFSKPLQPPPVVLKQESEEAKQAEPVPTPPEAEQPSTVFSSESKHESDDEAMDEAEDDAPSVSTASSSSASSSSSLSEYELARLQTIAKNREFLNRIADSSSAASDGSLFHVGQQPERKRRRKSVQSVTVRQEEQPTKRYSFRGSTLTPPTDNMKEADEEVEEEEKEEISEEEAGVRRYSCCAASTFWGSEATTECTEADGQALSGFTMPEHRPDESVCGFSDLGVTAEDEELQRIYTLDVDPKKRRYLAAGGHQGRVAVFDLARCAVYSMKCAEPLLSFKAHGGWISAVHFISKDGNPSEAESVSDCFLMTTGNDGGVVVWSLAEHEAPVAVSSIRVGTGIFNSDVSERDHMAVTACKDGSLRTFDLRDDGHLSSNKVYDGVHAGVCKCVRIRRCNVERPIFASCGNDACVSILDPRGPAESCTTVIAGAHDLAINGVDWSTEDENLLASTSFDRSVCLLDIRKPNDVVHRYTGHASSRVAQKKIHRAIFCCNGNGIACGGDGSTLLSLYDTRESSGYCTISRGDVGSELTTLYSTSSATDLLIAAHGRTISFFTPTTTTTTTTAAVAAAASSV